MGFPSVARGAATTAGVAALPWNQRQLSPGIGGSLAMESVAAFVWNGWQLCRGISGRIHLESVAALPWNTTQTPPGSRAWTASEGRWAQYQVSVNDTPRRIETPAHPRHLRDGVADRRMW